MIERDLAKLDDGLAESPTVMVVDKTRQKTIFGKNSWAFVGPKTSISIEELQPLDFGLLTSQLTDSAKDKWLWLSPL
jgi:hypothetical protein